MNLILSSTICTTPAILGRQICGMFLCSILLGIGAVSAQAVSSLPTLQTSYVNHFNQGEAAYSGICFSDVFLDHRGRLWLNVCGKDRMINAIGIFQFDGKHFTPVELYDAENKPILSPTILGVNQAGELFGSSENKSFFILNPDSRVCQNIPFEQAISSEFKIQGATDNAGRLFVLTGDDKQYTHLFEVQHNTLVDQQKFDYREGNWGYDNHKVYPTKQGVWVLGGTLPFFRFNLQSGAVRSYTAADFIQPVTGNPDDRAMNRFIPRMATQPSGNIYLFLPGYYGGHVYRFDQQLDKFVDISLQFPANWQPLNLFQDQHGNVCFLFQDAARRYRAIVEDGAGRRFDYSAAVQDQRNIFKLEGRNFFQNVFIVGSNGLHSIGLKQGNSIAQTLPGKWITTAAELPDKRILINTIYEGWFVYEPKTAQSTPFQGPDCQITLAPFGKGMKQQLISDGAGNFWFTNNNYLIRYNPESNDCKAFDLGREIGLLGLVNKHMLVIQTGNSTTSVLFDINTQKAIPLEGGLSPLKELNAIIRDYFTDSHGILWVPTNNGLWRFDIEQSSSAVLGIKDGFADCRFTAVCEDKAGRLWVGTYFGGLHIYDPLSGTITIVNQNQGLSNNAVMSIIADDDGVMWVSTERGINLVSGEGKVLKVIHQQDGLNQEKFERFDPMKSSDGKLWFGSQSGMNIIDPKAVKSGLQSPDSVQIYLTEIAYFDKDLNKKVVRNHHLQNLGTIDIPADYPYIQLKFGLSSYLEPQHNHYAYKLEGIDETWQFLGTQSELNIPRLPPGRYKIRIKGADFQNNWTTKPLEINIHAREFFYKQAWFYALCCLPFLIFGLIWARNKNQEARRLELEVIRRTEKIQAAKILIEEQAAELQELDSMKSRFFANISHELRTPITLITAPLENLIQKLGKSIDKSMENSLRLVLRNGQILGRLVEELLELSRLEAKKSKLKLTATPLTNFCRQLFHTFHSGAAMKKIQYSFHSSLPTDAHYLIDRNGLEKIVNNLISNALKFTPANGSIRMSVSRQQDEIVIEVVDTGRGIPESDLPFVFDRYFQTNQSVAPEGGSGIGLALSQELAHLMQGIISVQSKIGQGSSFSLRWPALEAAPAMPDAPMVTEPLSADQETGPFAPPRMANGKQKTDARLLIVEDNTDMQDLLHTLLSETYTCIIANNGAEAWALLETNDPSIRDIEFILSDVMMPEMDGYTFLDKVKNHPEWQQLPFVLLTARAAKESRLQALRMGVDDYLLKPFSPPELIARVQNLIGNYRVRKKALAQAEKVKTGVNVAFEEQPSADYTWLKEVEDAAKEAMDKGLKLTTIFLASKVFLSERQFSRNLKSLTGLTPQQYILEIKLQKARHLLENGVYSTAAEVAYSCGFSSGSYLAKVYQEHFGKLPGDYR